MSTIVRRGDPDLPNGYEFVHFEGRKLALPFTAAGDARREFDRRKQLLLEEQRAEVLAHATADKAQRLQERDQAEAEAKAETEASLSAADEEPAPGQYRVFRKWAELLEGVDDERTKLRSADIDVNKRAADIRKVLLKKGPDRRIAHPDGWRDAVDQLEGALPHFREPIRLLRNSLALADATKRPVRVPPMLLLGPPGVGKTYFTHRVAEMLSASHASIAFDQPTAGSSLRGSDSFWANSSTGVLFNLICMGDCANPVILLDELDKSSSGSNRHEVDPLAQLHGVLEPETSRSTTDISIGIEFDASQVTYIATANSTRGLTAPILSRLDVFDIEPPEMSESFEIARAVVNQVLRRMNLHDTLGFEHKGLYVLAHLSPRLMLRTTEKAIAAAVAAGQERVTEADLWAELGPEADGPRPH